MGSRDRAVVTRFGGPEVIEIRSSPLRRRPHRRTRVRVTHASVGATDVLARHGWYLFQPVPGFTPGYDFVGEVLEPAQGSSRR
jgi:NADPH:quinone reductase